MNNPPFPSAPGDEPWMQDEVLGGLIFKPVPFVMVTPEHPPSPGDEGHVAQPDDDLPL